MSVSLKSTNPPRIAFDSDDWVFTNLASNKRISREIDTSYLQPERTTNARKCTLRETRLPRVVLAKYSSADRADAENLDYSGLNLKVKFLGGGSDTLLNRVTDKLSCLAAQFADDKLSAMGFLWEVTPDIGV